ncbi:hypothetical protein O181_005530 [Austropuccinia psidii MF-1]|uniref:Uncharacterized protein n=1 Tax=Austropuccinia psidii MF-1 TaxID=1389203 RepID=A0A9Q3BIJ8_9BASI|nr:hypothetical protein [Austropuccinia psidii MF-1]
MPATGYGIPYYVDAPGSPLAQQPHPPTQGCFGPHYTVVPFGPPPPAVAHGVPYPAWDQNQVWGLEDYGNFLSYHIPPFMSRQKFLNYLRKKRSNDYYYKGRISDNFRIWTLYSRWVTKQSDRANKSILGRWLYDFRKFLRKLDRECTQSFKFWFMPWRLPRYR